jgi:hypothetical protein
MEISINYLAVAAAALANMVIGSLWYGPVFGKQWKAMMGFTDDDMRKMPLTAGQAIAGGIVTALVMSFVLAHDAFAWMKVMPGGELSFAFQLAFWIWLGYVATTHIESWLWEGKSFKLFAFNSTRSLVTLFAMSLILTYWR